VDAADLIELPDLGGAFNDGLAWRALVAELEVAGRAAPGAERLLGFGRVTP
jgi:hypothetical protein